MKTFTLALILLITTSCTPPGEGFSSLTVNNESSSQTPPPDEPQTPPEDVPEPIANVASAPWEDGTQERRAWTIHAFNSLENEGGSLLTQTPDDIEDYCPNYDQLSVEDRKNFWVQFLVTMSFYESNYNPDTKYKENFNDQHGNPIISRGLLQLSYESGLGYSCALTKEEDLHDPLINIDCSWKILNKWIEKDRVISNNTWGGWRGGARYWAVLRNTKIRAEIASWNSKSVLCL